jgi:hypothetical protein
MKTYPCTFCGEPFKTRSSRKTHNAKCNKNVDREKNQAAARDGSLKALKLNKKGRRARAKEFSEMFDDLPDGAFFAMAEEFGIEIDDFIE